MKVALTVWDNRISPVFDVASQIKIYRVSDGEVLQEKILNLADSSAEVKITLLQHYEVDYLICGAISDTLEQRLSTLGIKVISFVSGDEHKITASFLRQDWVNDLFNMPGCRFRKRKGRRCQAGRNQLQRNRRNNRNKKRR